VVTRCRSFDNPKVISLCSTYVHKLGRWLLAIKSPRDVDLDEHGLPVGGARVPAFWDEGSDFSGYLRMLREDRGWTTRRVAEKMNVSQAYVSKIENIDRKRPPNMDLVRKISDVYGVDLADVMHYAGYRFDVPKSVEQKINIKKAFKRIMNDERFKPPGFPIDDSRYLSHFVQSILVDVAISVAREVRDHGFPFEAWLQEEDE
jgi:transcriptional regulator with XRE-family HTH domain